MARESNSILITGGLGYVGGRLATHLASATTEISLRLMTRRGPEGIPPWAKALDVVQADLLNPRTLEAALENVDTVVHLAAIDENQSQQNPELALEVNGTGTHRLLQACCAQRVRRFIYLSTFHVYGPGVPQPITEASPTRPVHPYAITHRLAEDFVNWYRHSYGLETLILRLSNGYGYPADPNVQRWSLVFNDLCKQAVEKGEIRLRSSGAQHRDFISLTDVGRAIHHFLCLSSQEWRDGLFNLGGECSMSILQVAQWIAAEFSQRYGREIPIAIGEEEGGGPSPVVYSLNKLKQTGFDLVGNMSEEVLGTFALCEELARQPT